MTVKHCEWNSNHLVSSYNDERFCSSCNYRYLNAFTDLTNIGKNLRSRNVPKQLGGQTNYMDFWLYECLNRLASPETGMVYVNLEDLLPLADRGKAEISKSLTRLEEQGKLDLYKGNTNKIHAIYVHEDEETESITV